jgi:glycine/D-amino acid oxidase-like deaminating enzyme
MRTIVVGAGVAGLTCARRLAQEGLPVTVLEASEVPGGRVATRECAGFRLDAGFQVLPTAYPEANRWLDYRALALGRFRPGAMVWTGSALHRLADPFRGLDGLWQTLRAPVGTLADKLRLARWRRDVLAVSPESLLDASGRSTAAMLAERGFTQAMTDGFLRPWLGGILLDDSLEAPAAMASYAFRMFAEGSAALPRGGMGAIPRQLAAGLAEGTVRYGVRVTGVRPGGVTLETGESLEARHVVLAVDGASAFVLAGGRAAPAWRSVTTVYFDTPVSPLGGAPDLVLNGSGAGSVNSLCVPSDVAEGYAPACRSLVSVTLKAGRDLPAVGWSDPIQAEVEAWLGATVRDWVPLDRCEVRRALPVRASSRGEGPVRVQGGVWVCGDHVSSPSLQGAMVSGRETAEAILLTS